MNAAAHWAWVNGGTTPITGFHSVIDRPERVRRVMPPTTTISKISAQQPKRQAATAAGRAFAATAAPASGRAETVEKDTLALPR